MKKNIGIRVLTIGIILILMLTFGSSIALADSSGTDTSGTETVGAVDNPVQDAEYWLKMKTTVQWNGIRNCDCEITRNDWPIMYTVVAAPVAVPAEEPPADEPPADNPPAGDGFVWSDWAPITVPGVDGIVYERTAPCPEGRGTFFDDLFPNGDIYRSGYDFESNPLVGPDLISEGNPYPPDGF